MLIATLLRFSQFGGFGFSRAVTAGLEFVDSAVLDIKAGDGVSPAEFDGEGQANVAEADDGDMDGDVVVGL